MTSQEPQNHWLQKAAVASPENLEATAVVVELANAWSRGELPLSAVRTACSGWDRFIAMNHQPDDVRDMIDALVEDEARRRNHVMVGTGLFTDQDMRENGGLWRELNGGNVLFWPTSGDGDEYPWRYDHHGGIGE